jgi:vancomycin resistance protein YoaR
MLASIDVSKVLSAFESDFGGTGRGRATNIATAARYLNGTVLAPGQVLSFNALVGPRRIERGFTWAPVIVEDELESGVGGGVCQVASTLHAASVHGALEVVERRSHSRPSGYVPLGLDATVIDGEVDLKLKNPYDLPVIIHAFLPTPTRLRVELLGQNPPGKVEHLYAVTRTHEFYRRVTTKPWFEASKEVRRQKGRKGFDVVSVVRITYPDGRTAQRQYSSKYYPVPEVFWVGPGHPIHELPELPEGATYVEVDGVTEASVQSDGQSSEGG